MQEFIEVCKGFDQDLLLEILKTWKEGVCKVNKLRVEFNATTIIEAIHMRNKGKEIKRETKLNKLQEIATFKQPREHLVKNGPDFERMSLPKPWDEVTKAITRYVTLEGHHKTIYAYHFGLVNHFRFRQDEQVNFPFFIFHLMNLSILKCKETQGKIPRH